MSTIAGEHTGPGRSSELDALRLAAARGIGPATLRRLRDAKLDAAALSARSPQEIAQQIGCSVAAARALRADVQAVDAEAIDRAARAAQAVLLDPSHELWPSLLEALPDAPGFLWVRGDPGTLALPGVAIVGSRRCSLGGRLQAERFAQRLGGAGLSIISGGARGVDASAHRGALTARAVTIAVLGCGVDVVYPPEHDRMYREILESGGAIVSEHPPGVPPRPGHFPRRNRIIAALAIGTLVVEARQRSGALVTARLTIEELGRDCWALPARCDDAAALGSLRLLQRGEAAMVLDPSEVFEAVRAQGHLLREGTRLAFGETDARREPSPPLNDIQQRIDRALEETGGADQESLVRRTGLAAAEVQAALIMMELNGRVRRDATGEIRRV